MKYTPTEADKQTGRNVRALRRLAGETLIQTIERSCVGFGNSTLSKVELGQRALTLPEAMELAHHFNTTAEWIMTKNESAPVPTEQQWLGNDKPALFAVPDKAELDAFAAEIAALRKTPANTLVIDLDNPLSLEDYRNQVWIPYLENRYARDLKQTG